jgi:hypothetical protein
VVHSMSCIQPPCFATMFSCLRFNRNISVGRSSVIVMAAQGLGGGKEVWCNVSHRGTVTDENTCFMLDRFSVHVMCWKLRMCQGMEKSLQKTKLKPTPISEGEAFGKCVFCDPAYLNWPSCSLLKIHIH